MLSYLTAFDKFESEVDILLLVKDLACKNEVASVETGEMARGLDGLLAIECR